MGALWALRAAAEIHKLPVPATADMGCYKIDAATSINLASQNCNGNYCPDCFLLNDIGAFTFTNCPGRASTDVTYEGSTPHYVRTYKFINISGGSVTVEDGETTSTQHFAIAAGKSATAYCYNQALYHP